MRGPRWHPDLGENPRLWQRAMCGGLHQIKKKKGKGRFAGEKKESRSAARA